MDAAYAAGALPEDEVDAGYQDVVEAFRRAGDRVRAGGAIVRRAFALRVRGRTSDSRALLDQVVEMLEQEPPSAELADAYSSIAAHEMLAGSEDPVLEWTDKSIALAERLDIPGVVVRGLQLRGIVRATRGDLGGMEDMAEAIRMGLEHGIGRETNTAYVNLADWTSIYGEPAKGLSLYREGIADGMRRGDVRSTVWAKAETSWRLFELGRWDEVIEGVDGLARAEAQRGEAQPGG